MKSDNRAFSRADLLFCVVGVTLLFALAASLFASNKSESQRVVCFNNLRQIGRAVHVWANDHQELPHWQADASDGGTRGHPLDANLWFQYSWISNQLVTPKILVCPADYNPKKIATEWWTGPSGFLNPQFRDNSISYDLFLHALANSPRTLLSSDHNIRFDGISTCSFLVSGGAVAERLSSSGVGTWTNAIHGLAGHLLFMDGTVRFTTPPEFHEAVVSSVPDNSVLHALAL